MNPKTPHILLAGLCVAACALAAPDVAQKLFAGQALPAADQAAIAAQLPLKMQGGMLVDDSGCGREAYSQVEIRDLNGDGQPEVIVLAGNACASGMAGQTLTLFIKTDGKWVPHINVPSGGYKVLPTQHGGWPEIEVGGPGFCIPIWGMKGTAYDLVRQSGRCPRP